MIRESSNGILDREGVAEEGPSEGGSSDRAVNCTLSMEENAKLFFEEERSSAKGSHVGEKSTGRDRGRWRRVPGRSSEKGGLR